MSDMIQAPVIRSLFPETLNSSEHAGHVRLQPVAADSVLAVMNIVSARNLNNGSWLSDLMARSRSAQPLTSGLVQSNSAWLCDPTSGAATGAATATATSTATATATNELVEPDTDPNGPYGRKMEAIERLEGAIKFSPRVWQIRVLVAQCLMDVGGAEADRRGLAHIEAAIKLNPEVRELNAMATTFRDRLARRGLDTCVEVTIDETPMTAKKPGGQDQHQEIDARGTFSPRVQAHAFGYAPEQLKQPRRPVVVERVVKRRVIARVT